MSWSVSMAARMMFSIPHGLRSSLGNDLHARGRDLRWRRHRVCDPDPDRPGARPGVVRPVRIVAGDGDDGGAARRIRPDPVPPEGLRRRRLERPAGCAFVAFLASRQACWPSARRRVVVYRRAAGRHALYLLVLTPVIFSILAIDLLGQSCAWKTVTARWRCGTSHSRQPPDRRGGVAGGPTLERRLRRRELLHVAIGLTLGHCPSSPR